LTIPRRGSVIEGHRFAERNEKWLRRQLEKLLANPIKPKQWSIGTEILFRGRLVKLEAEMNGETSAVRVGDEKVPVPNGVVSGMMQQSMESSARDSDLASQTKLHGGDAVVIVQQGQILNGYAISGNGTYQDSGYGYGTANFNGDASARYSHLTKAFVVKYQDVASNVIPSVNVTNRTPAKIQSK
jgi:hypothetical protein